MRNMLTLAGREIRSYFSSPVAYVLIAVYLALAGYFFFALLSAFNTTLQLYSMMRNPELIARFNLNQMVIIPLLANLSVLLIFIVPAITMRMFPEEKRAGTYELLLTSPLRVGEIVLGKFLGGLVLVLLMVVLSGLFGALLLLYGNPEVPLMLSGYLGLALMAVVFLAIGTLVSSFTDNVVIAYVDMKPLELADERQPGFTAELVGRLRALPGVVAVAETTVVPLSGNSWGNAVWLDGADRTRRTDANLARTSPDYFATLGVPLLAGRVDARHRP